MREVYYTRYRKDKRQTNRTTVYKSLREVQKIWEKENCIEYKGKLIVMNEVLGEIFVYYKKE